MNDLLPAAFVAVATFTVWVWAESRPHTPSYEDEPERLGDLGGHQW